MRGTFACLARGTKAMWQTIYSSVDAISRWLANLAGGLIMLIAVMQLAEIILRNTAGISLPFVWEYAAYIHMAAIFLGLAYTLRTGGHIQVTLLKTVAPRLFVWTSTFVGLAISTILSFALIRLAISYGASGRSSGTINDVPLVYPAAVMAFGAALLTLQLVLRIIHHIVGSPLELAGSSGPSVE